MVIIGSDVMKIFEVSDDTIKNYLNIRDMENIFEIYRDKKNNYHYNLNSSIYFEFPRHSILTYTVTTPVQWSILSYKLYNSTRLAWLLMKINNVNPKNIMKKIYPGEKIKYISQEEIRPLVENINRSE